jgi:two-component system, OmpR family, KDP operon response regulator KdpE
MIETTATVIMIISERVGLHREEHALLLRNGYSVTEAQYGMDALLKLRDSRPDLIVLDLDMAAGRWLDICRDIRSETSAPILMLSARNTERDKVIALDSGIDDYVVKPFGVQELLARVRAALRRTNSTAKPETSLIFESGDLKIDFDRRTVLVRGKRVRLTPKEFALLHLLVMNQGRPIRHQMMLQSIWGRITAERRSISESSFDNSAGNLSPIQVNLNSSALSPGSAIGSRCLRRNNPPQRRFE